MYRFRIIALVDALCLVMAETANVTGRAKTGQRGALKTGQCYDALYTSSI